MCKQRLLGSVAGATREEGRQTTNIGLIRIGLIDAFFTSCRTAATRATFARLAGDFALARHFSGDGNFRLAFARLLGGNRLGRNSDIGLGLLLLWTLTLGAFTALPVAALVPIIAIVSLAAFSLLLGLALLGGFALALLVAFTLLGLLLRRLGRSKARVHIGHIIVEIIIRRLAVTLAILGSLCGRDNAEIMFGVLEIVLCHHRVAARLRVAGQLEILLGDMGGIAANLHVGTGALEIPRQRINVLAATIATALPVLVILIIGSHLVALSNFRNISVTLLADRLLPDLANP